MFLERHCPICERPARFVCAACWAALEPSGSFEVPSLASAWSLYEYGPEARSIVLAAKNQPRRDLLRAMAAQMALQIQQVNRFDFVTWVPASPARRRRRGLDQGRCLAVSLASRVGVKAYPTLSRVGKAQHGLGRTQRLVGPHLSASRLTTARFRRFSANSSDAASGQGLHGPTILLLDDVATTGASLNQAGTELLRAGAGSVHGLTFARVNRCRERAAGQPNFA